MAGKARRIAYTAVVGVAVGIVVYMTFWVLLTVVELVVLLYLGQEEEVPIPPPGDVWLRAPVLLLAVGGGLWVARRAWDEFSIDPRLPAWSLACVMAFSGTGIAIDQSRESAFLGCISADASRQAALEGAQTPQMTPGQVLREQRLRDQGLECRLGEVSSAVSSNPEYRLVAAGDQACAWLADRPWGQPPPASGRGLSTVDLLATYYREDLEASGGVLTAEEELSAEIALPAWDKLCPFQQDVHKGHYFRNGE
jgi:hypothetical protein